MQQVENKNELSNRDRLFDLDDISDLSEEVKKEIEGYQLPKTTDMILECFKLKRILSLTDINVAVYRLFNVSLRRTLIRQLVHNLKQKEVIRTVRRGIYEYVKD